MKASIATLLSLAAFNVFAQLSVSSSNTNAISTVSPGYSVVEQGPHHRVWQGTLLVTNQDGSITPLQSRYVELATAMAHEVNGEWVPSTDQFAVTTTGAEATNSQHQIALLGNLNSSGAVTLTTPEGRRLVSNLLGLSYFDISSGNSVWIGETKDSHGELLPSGNEAVFSDAFSGCSADVLYLNGISRFEQLVVIRAQLPPCTDFGMQVTNTLLCVVTEFLDPPSPAIEPQFINGVSDNRLNFGIMQMVHGDAFAIGTATNRIPVRKTWVMLGGRQCLVEAVPLQAVKPLLDGLPPATASVTPPGQLIHKLLAAAQSPKDHAPRFSALPSRRQVSTEYPPFKLARSLPSGKGLAMDYTFLTSQTNSFTFRGDTVYYVTNTVTLSAANNIVEGLAVVKFAQSPNASIVANGLIWKTRPYAPAIFTSKDDNTVGSGDLISGSSGNPTGFYGGTALDLSSASSQVIANARFSYLSNAVAGYALTLRNVQFNQCATALPAGSTRARFYNAMFYRIGTVIDSDDFSGDMPVFDNVTAHYCTNFMADLTSTINLTNCLFACVTNWQCLLSNIANCVFLTSDAGIFQTVGGGSHYLTNGSPYRGMGTTNIDAALLSDLRRKTTYPPIVYSSVTFSTDTTFSAQAQPDNGANCDLGWHYDPLDEVFGGCTANANLIFQAGTAAGWFRNGGGIQMANLKTVTFNGSATAPCWWVRYNTVQEQASSTWSGGSGWGGLLSTSAASNVTPELLT